MVQCTTPAVKTAAGVIKCTIVSDQIGFAYGLEVSDQGQLAKSLHDADRGTNYIAIPQKLAVCLLIPYTS